MKSVTTKHKEALDNYVLRGFVLKVIAGDLQPHLAGVVDGLCAETNSDTEAVIYKIDEISDDKVMLKPWKEWKDGDLSDAKGRRMTFYPYKPEGKSMGMFVSSSGKIAMPLLA